MTRIARIFLSTTCPCPITTTFVRLDTFASKLGSEDYEQKYRRVSIEEHNTAIMIQVCVIYNIVRIGQHGQKDHLVVDYGIFQGQTSRSEHTTMVSQLFVQQLGMAD